MISSEVSNSGIQQGKLTNMKELEDSDLNYDESIDLAIEAMEEEASTYQQAGLTQVSHWLE